MKRPDINEVRGRTFEVLDLLLQRVPNPIVAKHFSEKYKLTKRQAWHYIRKANVYMKKQSNQDMNKLIGESLLTYNKLYNKSYTEKDFKNCVAIQDRIVNLFGLAKPKQLDVKSEGSLIINFVPYKENE